MDGWRACVAIGGLIGWLTDATCSSRSRKIVQSTRAHSSSGMLACWRVCVCVCVCVRACIEGIMTKSSTNKQVSARVVTGDGYVADCSQPTNLGVSECCRVVRYHQLRTTSFIFASPTKQSALCCPNTRYDTGTSLGRGRRGRRRRRRAVFLRVLRDRAARAGPDCGRRHRILAQSGAVHLRRANDPADHLLDA